MPSDFDDLLDANAAYADDFALAGFDGVAHAGIAMLTCMDSRIDPLGMIGLSPGDAKIIRNPGGRLTESALEGLLLGVHLLGVKRVLIVAHTRCAVASMTADELRGKVAAVAGHAADDMVWHVVDDQAAALADDVAQLRAHPLMPSDVAIGGFMYDVDCGRLQTIASG
jgi:carbonic anhydrase